jgi:hypothetical protein
MDAGGERAEQDRRADLDGQGGRPGALTAGRAPARRGQQKPGPPPGRQDLVAAGGAALAGWLAPLAEAAARRHELTRSKAIQALRELDRDGSPVTFAAVAAAGRISRSWLYTQPDIRSQIQHTRDTAAEAKTAAVPARQRATSASLRSQLAAALERNRQLAAENGRLRQQLACALGDQRANRTQSRNNQPG